MLFPPETPSGAGPSGSATPAADATPPAGGTPPPPAGSSHDAQPFTTPADDYKAKYEEIQGKYKAWEKYGDPAQVEEALNWARARAAEIQAGKLRMVEDRPAADPTASADDFPPNWDELDSRQQRDWYRQDAKRTIAAERATLKAELEAPLRQQLNTIGLQQNIWMQASQLQKEYEKAGLPVSFEEAMAETQRIANADSSALLKMGFESKVQNVRMEKEVEQRVQEQLAKQKQEAENAELALIQGRGAPRFATDEPRNPREARDQARLKVLRTIREQVRGRQSA